MKRKLLFILCISLTTFIQAFAQNRTLTGTVTGKDDNLPIPGASVTVPGTQVGTQTNDYGKFTIKVPASAKSLAFSFVGYKSATVEIGSGDVINIALETNASQLKEVVVTSGYGIKQTARSNSNSAQVVSATDLNTVREPNINNALAGKVAGIQVRSQSAAALGRNTEVRLRGASGFGAGQGALYVVDGTILPNADDLNLDDVESVTVLQGAAAAALLGSQGANGAIVITTSKAKKNGGLGIDLRLGATWDKAYILPNYQNTYGGGNNPLFTEYVWKQGDPEHWKSLSGKYYPDYSDDSSWGPKLSGQEYIPWYAWYAGTKYTGKTASWTAHPDNAINFYQTAPLLDNSVVFNKGGDDYSIKIGYGNLYQKGIIPNQDLKRNTLNINYNYDLNKHLSFSTSINYTNQKQNGAVNDNYAALGTGGLTQWFHRDLDINVLKELRGLQYGPGQYASWNHNDPNAWNPANPSAFYAGNYWYNYYTYQDLIVDKLNRDRLFGDVALTYKVNNDLSFKVTYRKQQADSWQYHITPTELELSATQTGQKGLYATTNTYSNRENLEFLATYSKKIKDFKIDANFGTDKFNWTYKDVFASTNNGLAIPYLYNIGNSVDPPTITNTRISEKYNAVLGHASISWKDLIFLDGSLRNDWFSTFPQTKNDVLSKSFGLSFIFSDLLKSQQSWLSYGKLRATYGQIPKALGATNETFGAYRYPGASYGVSPNKFNGQLLQANPTQSVDPQIHGSTVTQRELGLDLRFFNDRIGISGTYWTGSETDIPSAIGVNGASGVNSILTNFGDVEKKGFDLNINAYPIRVPNFSWNFSLTYSNLLEDKVVEISNKYNVQQIVVATNAFTQVPYLVQKAGYAWGQIFGSGILRNAAGVPILDANGFYQRNPAVYYGSALPKHTGGMQNTFTLFKDFAINFNIDYQFGGKFASLSNAFGSFSGTTARTAALNDKGNPVRDAVSDGGGIHVTGVDANGKPVSTYVSAYDYYHNNFNNGTEDEFVYDLTFIKLREAGISYRIPVKKLGLGNVIKNATFQIQAHDLWLIYAKSKDYDPSQISAVQGEQAQLPGTRGFGFNLRVGF
ncbi:SusC/RagA family TonB-linked outer membrane protein [Mucilaginibacter sp. L3T2-6]|uniref:SusC/RagA family TonB-linked outer membrane protein n=1 Tax=Mucilaginibacter sp. L3T2-6 TaxID=3062491 RepID=UPI002675884A|nr:SusC/RagA family TonB-linked outer membrane protein [Mucilaginibacter sp. L3T2-6]MDO3642056.1 SusC/RagA family TonB-linked outer membrane protein [Mucilaginibacter sp. L3T2-6]MDV6214550.1 SusC/RagA family TonB-linked outer membrane protein [Mucilaginibacter sp. L3T2-6]